MRMSDMGVMGVRRVLSRYQIKWMYAGMNRFGII